MSVLPNLISRFSVMPVSYFVDLNKIILKFYRVRRPINTILMEKKWSLKTDIIWLQTYYKAPIIKIVWYWWKNKWSYRRESAATDPHKHSLLTSDKGAKTVEQRQPSQEMVLEQLDTHRETVSLDTEFTLFTNINSKSITGPNVRHRNDKTCRGRYRGEPRWLGTVTTS